MKCLKVGMLKEGKKSKSIFIILSPTRYIQDCMFFSIENIYAQMNPPLIHE